MPLYQQIIITLPKVTKEALVGLFKRHSKTVLENKGNLRAIENHGIRPLPERTRRRYAVTDGSRYFWEARFVCSTFDASPAALKETERLLRNEESVLKFFTVKLKTAVDRSKATSYKNPYLK